MIEIAYNQDEGMSPDSAHSVALILQHVVSEVGKVPEDGMIIIACEHVADARLNETYGEAYGNGWGPEGQKLWESFSGEFEASEVGDALIKIFFHGKV